MINLRMHRGYYCLPLEQVGLDSKAQIVLLLPHMQPEWSTNLRLRKVHEQDPLSNDYSLGSALAHHFRT